MLWLALHFPKLPLDRIQRRQPESVRTPLAICTTHERRRTILMANDTARALGIHSGQPVATALALCAGLELVDHDEADQKLAVEEAALAALRFTPSVALREDGMVLEVAASLRLFGGRQRLVEQLAGCMRALGLSACMGEAATAVAAWMRARASAHREDAPPLDMPLEQLPLHLLEQAAGHVLALEGIGCKTLGDLERLPRAGVARRFGPSLLAELDAAFGRAPVPERWYVAPESFAGRIELLARVDHAGALLFAAHRLMLQMQGWLVARQVAIGGFTLHLHHEPLGRSAIEPTRLIVRLAAPSQDADHLAGLLRERLTQHVLAAPVVEVGLSAEDIQQTTGTNRELFPTAQSQASTLAALYEKLALRLGHAAVQAVHALADHRPERACGQHDPIHVAAPKPGPVVDAPRPVWMFQAPLALEIRHERPVYGGALSLLAGPERIEAGWWDDQSVARDYYMAQNAVGQLLWVFRQRIPSDGHASWYLHGLFG